MNNDNNNELIWGEIKVQDLLKKLYKGKSLEQMSEKEVDRMLEDAYNEFKDVTFYVIDGKLERFGKNYGIGVDKDFTKIIYYYSNPD